MPARFREQQAERCPARRSSSRAGGRSRLLRIAADRVPRSYVLRRIAVARPRCGASVTRRAAVLRAPPPRASSEASSVARAGRDVVVALRPRRRPAGRSRVRARTAALRSRPPSRCSARFERARDPRARPRRRASPEKRASRAESERADRRADDRRGGVAACAARTLSCSGFGHLERRDQVELGSMPLREMPTKWCAWRAPRRRPRRRAPRAARRRTRGRSRASGRAVSVGLGRRGSKLWSTRAASASRPPRPRTASAAASVQPPAKTAEPCEQAFAPRARAGRSSSRSSARSVRWRSAGRARRRSRTPGGSQAARAAPAARGAPRRRGELERERKAVERAADAGDRAALSRSAGRPGAAPASAGRRGRRRPSRAPVVVAGSSSGWTRYSCSAARRSGSRLVTSTCSPAGTRAARATNGAAATQVLEVVEHEEASHGRGATSASDRRLVPVVVQPSASAIVRRRARVASGARSTK